MTDYSPAPGTPQTSTKAIAATVLTFITAFAGIWIADVDPFTSKEFVGALVTAAIGAGITGGVTRQVKNSRK